MKVWIELTDPPDEVYQLCSEQAESPSGFTILGDRALQESRPFRALKRRYRNRNNQGIDISFSVHRLHTSEAAASAYILDHQTNVPREGTVFFEERVDSGDPAYIIRSVPNAVIQQTQSQQIGKTTRHRYRIVGGEMQIPSEQDET